MTTLQTDVCILGAGMAGLTLARQLRQQQPELDIVLLEHRTFPVPEATHKVGESTVEIAAHYLAETLNLGNHLRDDHLPKFGLRLFNRGDTPVHDDLAQYDEIGVSRVLPIPTFQVDRGRLENHLARTLTDEGVKLVDGATIRDVDMAPNAHAVTLRHPELSQVKSRFLVDSSGRRALLRAKQNIERPVRHNNHAVWFRVQGALNLDDWSTDATWRARCEGTPRRLSTNHFTGPGYWVWLIPLASGTTSVGVVFDPNYVDLDHVRQHDRFMAWLQGEHPLLAGHLSDRAPLDFHVLKNYAAGCKENFSEAGWMLSGDAGMFSDPFYSPGADFIAFANGYISELIRTDNADPALPKQYQGYLQTFFSNTLSLYRGQYGGFGDRDMMVMKTIWDYAYYWGPLAKLYFSGRFTDTQFMAAAQDDLRRAATLNSGMQKFFRELAQRGRRTGGEGRFFDHYQIPVFHSLKAELEQGDNPELHSQLVACVERLEAISQNLTELGGQVGAGAAMPDLTELGQRAAFA